MVNENNLIEKLKLDTRVFKLLRINNVEFISKELLELSQVKLSYKILMGNLDSSKNDINNFIKIKNELIDNIPYSEEVYFDELLSNALKCYSGRSYRCINGYLRFGLEFFESEIFKEYCINNRTLSENNLEHPDYNLLRFKIVKLKKNIIDFLSEHKKWDKNTKKDKNKLKKADLIKELDEWLNSYKDKINIINSRKSKENIRDKINKLDKCFLELAPRNSDDKKYYFRGMTQLYNGLTNINDTIIINTYLSLSNNPNVPYNPDFWNKTTNCCYYRFKIDKGVPYINMINTTFNEHEGEILLPRNLKLTLESIIHKTRINGILIDYMMYQLKCRILINLK